MSEEFNFKQPKLVHYAKMENEPLPPVATRSTTCFPKFSEGITPFHYSVLVKKKNPLLSPLHPTCWSSPLTEQFPNLPPSSSSFQLPG